MAKKQVTGPTSVDRTDIGIQSYGVFLEQADEYNKFKTNLIVPKGGLDSLRADIEMVATNMWGEDAKKILKQLAGKGTLPIRDGDLKEWAGYAGNDYLVTSNKVSPQVFDLDGTPITKQSVGRPYNGSKIAVFHQVYAWEGQWGPMVLSKLLAVKFLEHGTPFTGASRVIKHDVFDDLEATNDRSIDDELQSLVA